MAAVNLDDGSIDRAQIDSGIMGAELQNHPGSGVAFSEVNVPDWQSVKDLAVSAALAFPGFNIIGWDIAITRDGPCVIEGNTNPDHSLYQLASAEGLLGNSKTRLIKEQSVTVGREQAKNKKNLKKESRGKFLSHLKQVSSQGISNK